MPERSELHRRVLAGQQGRDRANAVRDYVRETADGVFDPETLQEIADGPIVDPNRIYLPAGRLTEQQYRERMAAMNKRGPNDRT